MDNSKRLQRNTQNKVIAGVCSGLADYFGIDAALMRVLFVVLFFAGCSGFLIYFILWIVMPSANRIQSQPVDNVQSTPTSSKNGKGGWIVGLILIVLGCLCLIGNLVPNFNWATYWPILLIVLGLLLIVPFKMKDL